MTSRLFMRVCLVASVAFVVAADGGCSCGRRTEEPGPLVTHPQDGAGLRDAFGTATHIEDEALETIVDTAQWVRAARAGPQALEARRAEVPFERVAFDRQIFAIAGSVERTDAYLAALGRPVVHGGGSAGEAPQIAPILEPVNPDDALGPDEWLPPPAPVGKP